MVKTPLIHKAHSGVIVVRTKPGHWEEPRQKGPTSQSNVEASDWLVTL